MDFTLTFIKLFFYGLFLASPILSTLILVIILLGQRVGRKEGWTCYDALYWSFITATTVGYGDLKPSIKLSKTFAVFIAFTGLICSGIIVAIAVDSVLEAFRVTRDIESIQATFESISK